MCEERSGDDEDGACSYGIVIVASSNMQVGTLACRKRTAAAPSIERRRSGRLEEMDKGKWEGQEERAERWSLDVGL